MKHIFTLFCFLLMAKPCLSQDIEVNIIDVSCNGNCDGQVTITASGGVAPYEYSIDGGVTFQNSNIFFNLCPGSYDVLTRDSEEITANLSIEITEPDFLDAIITVTPSGTEPSGVLLLEVFGGYLPYEYSIDFGNTYQFENTFSDLPVSTSNTVIVRDAAGCESLYVFAIEQTSFDNTLVVTGNDLTANLDALSYRWIDAETQMPIEGETNKTFTAEEPGDYRVEMTIDDSSTTLKSVNSKGQKAIITVSSPTYELATLSVTSNEENTIKIHPNPASDYLILPITTLNKDYTIYSALGQKVDSGKVLNEEVSLKTLDTGLYYLIMDGVTAKFIKN